jgi:excisionase family DNA binding protein
VRERLLNYNEVAAVLGCSSATVKRRVATGSLPAFRDGRLRRIPEDALHRFILERVERHGPQRAGVAVATRILEPGARLWD